MPHELLGDVHRPGTSSGLRRKYVLPLSIVLHAAVIAVLVIVPLAAEVELPSPMRPSARIVHVVTPMPRPVVVSPPKGPPAVVRRASPVAPSGAPTGIAEEKIVPTDASGPPGPPSLGPIGDPNGIDASAIGRAEAVIAPSPPPAPTRPIPVGGKIGEPRKIVDVAPLYPPLAIAARKEGVVILEATLDEQGRVDRLRVLRSEPLLDEAAIQAVRRWRYTPTLLNGTPVPVLMTITVRFSLR
jgi:protein TonB